MFQSKYLGLALIAAVLCLVSASGGDEPKTKPVSTELVGTWQLETRKLGDQERPASPQEMRMLHITPSHVIRVVFDPKSRKIIGTAGGQLTIDGDKYTETIQWADEGSRMGKDAAESVQFRYKVEKDRLQLVTTLGEKQYTEVWVRIDAVKP